MTTPLHLFKLLADDTRLNAVVLLHTEGELCVCELVEALEESQPKVSRHLAQLRSGEILKTDRRGQWIYYSLSDELEPWVKKIIQAAAEGKSTELEQLKLNLQRMRVDTNCCAS
ncbi:MAG: metalloregulator ArsR/SmtB family transcription factor [Oceanobacter sp.]